MTGVGRKLPVLGAAAPGAPHAPQEPGRRRDGVPCTEAYLHFELARRMGRRAYDIISTSGARNTILGELRFAEHRRGAADERIDRELEPLCGDRAARRRLVDDLGAACVAQLEEARPDLVGLTTPFHQRYPSLWLARLIKQRPPAARVILGGASCAAPMGPRIAEHDPEVDLVVSGHGEQVLVDLARGRVGFEARFLHGDARVARDERVEAVIRRTHEPTAVAALAEETGADAALLARLADLGVRWQEAGQVINLVVALPDDRGGADAE